MELKNFPFYQLCRDRWESMQEKQIVKGLHKYEEAFNPSHWTPDELLDHALEESVDLVHYIVGLSVKNKELQRDMLLLKAELAIKTHQLELARIDKGYEKKPSYADLDDEY